MSSPPQDLLNALDAPQLHPEINNVIVLITNADGSTTNTDLSHFSIQDRTAANIILINQFARQLFDNYWMNDFAVYDKYHLLNVEPNLVFKVSFARPAEWYFTPA